MALDFDLPRDLDDIVWVEIESIHDLDRISVEEGE
jgi:hypothetical protein